MKPLVRFKNIFTILVLMISSSVTTNTIAATEDPTLDIIFSPDESAQVTLTTGALRILTFEGLGDFIFTGLSSPFDSSNLPFFMEIYISNTISDGNGGSIHTANFGTMDIDNGNLLNAVLSNISFTSSSSNEHSITADLTYTSGTLIPTGVSSGQMETSFIGSSPYLDEEIDTNIGDLENPPVVPVPVPAAIWLFAFSLLSLSAYRKK